MRKRLIYLFNVFGVAPSPRNSSIININLCFWEALTGIGAAHHSKKLKFVGFPFKTTMQTMSIAETLGLVTDYVENPEKTSGGDLASAYQCNPSIANQVFLSGSTPSLRAGKGNYVIAYHLRQSFKPGEITPEQANKIGCDLAMSLTKGNHAFIACTHVDKYHIHSHIVSNSTTLDCTRKFQNFCRFSFAIRKIPICSAWKMVCL